MSDCSIAACSKSAVKRTWCQMHYTRWHRHGSPTFTKIEMHGLTKHVLYPIWVAMKDRCYNSNNKFYYLYGGRGIDISQEWLQSFQTFLKDMGNRPEGYSIERRNNNLGYSRENCYWATPAQQAHNRRSNRYLTINNQTKTIMDWCRKFNVDWKTVDSRIKKGWTNEQALATPIRKRG